MQTETLVFSVFLIFFGAAILATLALYARQSMLTAYILLGVLLGPWGINLVPDPKVIEEIAHVGIIFLLFLLGLDLDSNSLIHMFRKTTVVTLISSLVFALISFGLMRSFGFSTEDAVIIAAAMMFSSTILGLKLLPTTILHHKHMGEVIISILLMQDLIAIILLIILHGQEQQQNIVTWLSVTMLLLPVLVAAAMLAARFILVPLLVRFDTIREYIFLLAIGWCLGLAEFAQWTGLSPEIGAFIAGVALARHPIAMYITDSLRPLRDFFLVMFFFSLGAGFDLASLQLVWLPASLLAVVALLIKPFVFKWLLVKNREKNAVASEIGYRLGQISEFSLLLSLLAQQTGVITDTAAYTIQFATLLTFIFSSYFIVQFFPTPIAVKDTLRRD